MMTSLSSAELNELKSIVGDHCSIQAAAVVRLYRAERDAWNQLCLGMAALVTSAPHQFLKVIDLPQRKVLVSQRIARNWEYESPRPFFHTFESNGSLYGISFAEPGEAEELYSLVQKYKNAVRPLPPPPTSTAPSLPAGAVNARTPVTAAPATASAGYRPHSASSPPSPSSRTSSASSLQSPLQSHRESAPESSNHHQPHRRSKLHSFFGSLRGKKEKEHPEMTIGEPYGFVHLRSIGWNAGKGVFEVSNIPPEWRKIFIAAGITPKQLANPDTAKIVMETVTANCKGGHGPVFSYPPPNITTRPARSSSSPVPMAKAAAKAPLAVTAPDQPASRRPLPPPPSIAANSVTAPPAVATGDIAASGRSTMAAPPPPPIPARPALSNAVAPAVAAPPVAAPPPPPLSPNVPSLDSVPTAPPPPLPARPVEAPEKPPRPAAISRTQTFDSRSDLLKSIEKGPHLRHVDKSSMPAPSHTASHSENDIVSVLQRAMDERLKRMQGMDDNGESVDSAWDEYEDWESSTK